MPVDNDGPDFDGDADDGISTAVNGPAAHIAARALTGTIHGTATVAGPVKNATVAAPVGSPSISVASQGTTAHVTTTGLVPTVHGTANVSGQAGGLNVRAPHGWVGSVWIQNLCPNPSFENNADGWTALAGTNASQSDLQSFKGLHSLLVTTDGSSGGQGVFGPMGTVIDASQPVTVSLYLMSETGGTLRVQAAANPGGIVMGQTVVTLQPGRWQRVTIEGVTIPAVSFMYVVIQTTVAEAVAFFIDAVQYEPSSTASDYIDGDSEGSVWDGTPGNSTSYKPFQVQVVATGGMFMEGTVTILERGEAFSPSVPDGPMVMTGGVTAAAVDPVGALDDFAMYETVDLDPAMTYPDWSVAAMKTGHTGYNRVWGVFTPPLDYPVSDGSLLWPRASYAAVGFEFLSVGVTGGQHMTMVQVEKMPIAGTDSLDDAPTPSEFDTPRSLHMTIIPSRLNYITNPSFETDTTGWSANGTATLAQDATVWHTTLGGDFTEDPGLKSGKVVMNAATDSVSIQVSNLMAGDTYIASVWCRTGNSGTEVDFPITVGQAIGGVAGASGNPLDTHTWYRSFVIFTAPDETVTLQVQTALVAGGTWPHTFWIDEAMVEHDELLQNYFDGSFGGPDFQWEAGGTANLARSYWYPNYSINVSAINDILSRHIPVDTTPFPPQYATPPTKSGA